MTNQNETDPRPDSATQNALAALEILIQKIALTVDEGKREGVLRPTEELYSRYPVDEQSIKEGEFGLERVNYATEEITKDFWLTPTRTVLWRLQESPEWMANLTMLEQTRLSAEEAKRLLESLAHCITYKFLETDDDAQRRDYVARQTEVLRKHLDNELFRHTSQVRLVGLVPPSSPIEFKCADVDVLLRRPERADLVEEQFAFIDREWPPSTPTAILTLSKTVERENEVQQLVWRAITVLRLFRAGSVRELSYTDESDSFFALGGTLKSHRHYARVATAVLGEEDGAAFENFWTRIMPQLPNEGYGHNRERVVSTDISYNRYSDALLSWGMPVERRISDAVIGLESLFLSEMDELSYRLRLRVAKLLGIFGFVSGSVKDTVGLAYEVRSCFLHGSLVSRKVLTKIERQHVSLDKLIF